MLGCTARANSSKTMCWYCISVTNRPAWNRRSPSQALLVFKARTSASMPAAVVGSAPAGSKSGERSHSVTKAVLPLARIVCL